MTTADDWRIPDELWARIAPLLPPGKPHPLGCHNPRVDDPRAMDAIFFTLRTGCQGLAASDKVVGIDWAWLSMDGAMIKAPLGGGENRPQSHRPGQARHQAQSADGRRRRAGRAGGGRGQPQ